MSVLSKFGLLFIILEIAFLFPYNAYSEGPEGYSSLAYPVIDETANHISPANLDFFSDFEIPEESEKEEEESSTEDDVKKNFSFYRPVTISDAASSIAVRLSLFSESHVFTSFSSLYLVYCCIKTCHAV